MVGLEFEGAVQQLAPFLKHAQLDGGLAHAVDGVEVGRHHLQNGAISPHGFVELPTRKQLAGMGAHVVQDGHPADTLSSAFRMASVMALVPSLVIPGCMISPVR